MWDSILTFQERGRACWTANFGQNTGVDEKMEDQNIRRLELKGRIRDSGKSVSTRIENSSKEFLFQTIEKQTKKSKNILLKQSRKKINV